MVLPRRSLLLLGVVVPISGVAQNQPSKTATFTITGKVNSPGTFEIRDGMRITDAIVAARGFADFAHKKRITLIRGDDRYIFNYAAYQGHQDEQSNLLLRNQDRIIVP